MRTFALALAAALVLWAVALPAQAATRAGDQEIGIAVNIQDSDANGTSTTSTTLFGSYGLFLDRNLQVGGSFIETSADTEGAEATVRFIDGFAKYHFTPEEVLVPYVGGQGGIISVEFAGESSSGISFGFMLGGKYFTSEDVSLNGEFNYRIYEIDVGGTTVDVETTTLLFGISIYFST